MDDSLFAPPGDGKTPASVVPAKQPVAAVVSAPAALTTPVIVPTLATDGAGRNDRQSLSVSPGWIALILSLALVVGALGGVGAYLIADNARTSVDLPGTVSSTEFDRPEGSVAAVAAAALPSVVAIDSTNGGAIIASGSGFVIHADGYILTNHHVVASSDGTVRIVYADGEVETGTVVGSTADYDLAVVKVDREGLVPLVLGDSSALVVGDPVIAIGSPLGLDATVTTGIVSSLHRPVGGSGGGSFIDAIQTDAAINPGNSGGPLVNAVGEVIGINSAVAALPGATQASGAGSVGLGFAIPSNQARRTAEEIIETGEATYPVVGVLLDETYLGQGVRIIEDDPAAGVRAVVPGSPADLAGLRAGDIIISIDGRPVTRPSELVVAIRAHAPGDVVVLEISDDGTVTTVSIELTANVNIVFEDGSE